MKSILRNPIIVRVLGLIIWAYMALCHRTIRWTVLGDDAAKKVWLENTSVIIAAWHSTILLLPSGWHHVMRRWPKQKKHSAMLISLSRDGEAVARAISHLGLSAVRGSTNHSKKKRDKGGLAALNTSMRLLREGAALCITPDGPRGPAETVQNGPVLMSMRTGTPILPYAILSKPERRLNTWDGFRIPYPFSRGVVVFGDIVQPGKGMDKDMIRHALERSLNAAMQRAERFLSE